MKNKYLLTVKYALASMVLGVLGLVGAAAISEPVSASQDVVLSVVIDNVPYSLSVVSPADGGQVGETFSLDVSGQNIDTVAVYVDFNGDNTYEPSELLGTFGVASALSFGPGYFVGPVTIPTNVAPGSYKMKVVGVQYNGGDAETASITTIVYSSTAPQIDKISPDKGSTLGGDEITIFGQNFDASSRVFIGNNECLNVVVVSSTKITCNAPAASSAGQVAVTVEGPNGIYTDSYGFLYYVTDDTSTGGGSWIMGLPRVPNTGLFRVGNTVVMSSDFMIAGLLVVIIILGWVIIKRKKECKKQAKKPARKPTKNGAKAVPAKRVRTRKGTAKRK
jgi:hypothetical protein